MTDNQAFNFLSRFARPSDVKIIMKNKKIGLFNVLGIAFALFRKVPIAKIIGKKWFYGLEFYTNKNTLDPRPDSETLTEAVIAKYRTNPNIHILDIGTGTGCLIASIVKNLAGATGIGIDKSGKACKVARKNMKTLGLEDRIKIINKDMGSLVALAHEDNEVNIIISNPPYIPTGDKRLNAGARHDPKMALYGGRDGLDFYKKIAKIKANSDLFLEIGAGQSASVRKIFNSADWKFIKYYKDLSGRIRVLEFNKSLSIAR